VSKTATNKIDRSLEKFLATVAIEVMKAIEDPNPAMIMEKRVNTCIPTPNSASPTAMIHPMNPIKVRTEAIKKLNKLLTLSTKIPERIPK